MTGKVLTTVDLAGGGAHAPVLKVVHVSPRLSVAFWGVLGQPKAAHPPAVRFPRVPRDELPRIARQVAEHGVLGPPSPALRAQVGPVRDHVEQPGVAPHHGGVVALPKHQRSRVARFHDRQLQLAPDPLSPDLAHYHLASKWTGKKGVDPVLFWGHTEAINEDVFRRTAEIEISVGRRIGPSHVSYVDVPRVKALWVGIEDYTGC